MSLSPQSLLLRDVTLAYLDSGGNGAPVVILHGFAGSTTEFLPTAEALPEFRVLLVDQRGHGRSARIPGDLSRDAFVADVVQIIERVVGGPVALVGQSMGAHTAMLVAARRPDLVERLVILEGGAGGASAEDNIKLGKYFRSWPVPFADHKAASDFLGDGPLERAWIADLEHRRDGLWPRFDADVMIQTVNAIAQPRWGDWQNVAAPTLVVYANNGLFTGAEKTEFISRGHLVRRVDLANASHDAHLDTFEEWVRVLRSFLCESDTGR